MTIDFNTLYFDLAAKPRVHGNGFIQIDLPEKRRLHIWPNKQIEAQKVYTGIHNHRFSISSSILLGKLCHFQFGDLVKSEDGLYKVYKPVTREGEDTVLELYSPDLYNLSNPQKFYLSQGSEYTFEYGRFHESKGIGLTATLMQKTYVDENTQVLVACPKDKEPDNDFGRYQIEDKKLWPIIEEVFNKIKRIIY